MRATWARDACAAEATTLAPWPAGSPAVDLSALCVCLRACVCAGRPLCGALQRSHACSRRLIIWAIKIALACNTGCVAHCNARTVVRACSTCIQHLHLTQHMHAHTHAHARTHTHAHARTYTQGLASRRGRERLCCAAVASPGCMPWGQCGRGPRTRGQ